MLEGKRTQLKEAIDLKAKAKRIVSIIIAALLCTSSFADAARWTEETARQEVFKDVKRNIDISKYPTNDPYYEEHQKALAEGTQDLGNRFISKNPEPPVGYVVSELDRKRTPRVTFFYGDDGHLVSLRLFSKNRYPRVAYIYCVNERDCQDGDLKYKTGEIMSVSLHLSAREAFYFRPDGTCTGHVKY